MENQEVIACDWTDIFNRPGVAGVVQSLLVSHPCPPDIHNIINPKPLELVSLHFERVFTPHHVSCAMYHVSLVTCHLSPVTCHLSHVNKKKMDNVAKLVSG